MDTEKFVKIINKMWLSDKYVYPGPQPVSIERKHFPILTSKKYYIGHKNDGERIALCILRYEEKPRCFILNRKLELTPISLLISQKMYEGTIFDCELVNKDIYIFDCPLFAGESLKNRPFSERLSFADAFLSAYRHRSQDTYSIYAKQFVLRKDYGKLETCLATDGYIFVPENKYYQVGTHKEYFKWKPQIKNTIDFAIGSNNQAYLQNAGKYCKTSVIINNDDNVKLSDSTYTIVECQFVSENKWNVLQIRNDKNMPNSLYTFKRTLVNIEENIQFSELVS